MRPSPSFVRALLLAAPLAALTAWPALGAPVYVSPNLDFGPVPTSTAVVAFSYDVRSVFPAIDARYAPSRPQAPRNAGAGKLPLLRSWNEYSLTQAKQLQDFRVAFQRAHQGEEPLLKALMPQFNKVYEKYGDTAPFGAAEDALAPENPRKAWCKKVTADLNTIITSYNRNGLAGAPSADGDYERAFARWLAQRNEALRTAALKAGANETLAFVEGETSEGGQAVLDLPPGMWYVACQAEGRSWYKPIRVAERGGHIVLPAREAQERTLDLAAWTGN